MFSEAQRNAIERTEPDVNRFELEALRRIGRFSFYSEVAPFWLMDSGERAALFMLIDLVKPRVVIEVGTAYGRSAFLFAQRSERVICIDINPAVRARCAEFPNIEVRIGKSKEQIPLVLDQLRAEKTGFDLALIDGNHSPEGVKADVEAFIAERPQHTAWLILHDTLNPDVRSGILSVDWSKPWVAEVELDFVPGNLKADEKIYRQMWGGIGVVEVRPTDRDGALRIGQEAHLLYAAAYSASCHRPIVRMKKYAVNRFRGLKRKLLE